MSREKKTRMIEETYCEIKCDFCEKYVESKRDSLVDSITKCQICKKDFCIRHGKLYYDSPSYKLDPQYPDFVSCQDCVPQVDVIWAEGVRYLKRYDSLYDYVIGEVKKELEREQKAQQDEDMDQYQSPEYH